MPLFWLACGSAVDRSADAPLTASRQPHGCLFLAGNGFNSQRLDTPLDAPFCAFGREEKEVLCSYRTE